MNKILLIFLVLIIIPVNQANAISIRAHWGQSGLLAYNIMMNIKINGHPVIAELDTGMDFTLIPQNYASSLGLDQLQPVGVCSLAGIGGGQQCNVVEVLMQIENSHPFYTKVLLSPQGNIPAILLSAYALYQAYHLQFIPIR